MYKERAIQGRSDEAMEEDNRVRSAKKGQLAKDFGVVMTRPTLAVTSFSSRCRCYRCLWARERGKQRSTRARGKLSEAKTQRRPHSAERKSEIWEGAFICCFVVFVSFF